MRIGLLVSANTFREPALVAKMVTTLDHISHGRAILGIGAGWSEPDHTAYGLRYGDSAAERLRWLAEALPVIRGMVRGEAPSASGPRYHATAVPNLPLPIQQPLPILVGGDGERVTLRLVAAYGDACNIGFHVGLDALRRKDAALRRHCEELGRDEREIERTTEIGVVIIRDTQAEARKAYDRLRGLNGDAPYWPEQPVGTPESVAELLEPVVRMGFRHLVFGFPFPHDQESMTRLVTEVKPWLERSIATEGPG